MAGFAPQSQSQPPPPSAEEEALKRNTDCVYFLASPLTCKKGSECEYRHSDVARINPRDCYFWLHGNCLNPKCSFRHPPLDGLLGTQKPTPTGVSAPIPQPVTAPTPHVSNNSTKQGPACIFFQKGYCLKGDWCPFPHVSPSLSSKPSLAPGTVSTTETGATFKKASSGLDKSLQSINVAKSLQEKSPLQPMNAAMSAKDFSLAKRTVEVKSTPAPHRIESSMNRRVPQTSAVAEFPGFKRVPYASNGIQESWSGHVQHPHLFDEPESNNKDAEELSREPSPGFDVLVDDDNRESDYYPGDDRYGMSMEHETGNDYDIDNTADYNMVANVDDEQYQDVAGYDSHDRYRGQYPWDHHGRSSERMSGGSYPDRRSYDRADPDQFDLRHRLSKHKRSNGLRSVINHEHGRDQQVGERNYHGSRRDEQHNTRSSRLQGRISIPGTDRSRISSRLSPVRTSISPHQGRIRDRMKGRVEETFNNEGKSHRGFYTRRDTAGDNSINFAGPKSLAELKNRKNRDPVRQEATEQQSLGKRKHSTVSDRQQHEKDVTFEGPKPLEEILKRKRRETNVPTSGGNSSNNQSIIEAENQEGINATKNEDPSDPTLHPVDSKIEGEDGEHPEDAPGPELEAYDQRGGEFDYEQVDGVELYASDGENVEAGEEYIDEEDDDDDFAKKMGVIYS